MTLPPSCSQSFNPSSEQVMTERRVVVDQLVSPETTWLIQLIQLGWLSQCISEGSIFSRNLPWGTLEKQATNGVLQKENREFMMGCIFPGNYFADNLKAINRTLVTCVFPPSSFSVPAKQVHIYLGCIFLFVES